MQQQQQQQQQPQHHIVCNNKNNQNKRIEQVDIDWLFSLLLLFWLVLLCNFWCWSSVIVVL